MLVAFLSSRPAADFGGFEVKEADARRAASVWPDLEGKVDAIITSPPYATALPYLDTDRLSLIYLGLLPRSDHRRRDQDMIGNREISERQRSDLWGSFEENCDLLPNATVALVNQIHGLNQNGSVGFRRRNLSALLGRYFFDMRAALQQQHSLLKRGGKAFMVVGNNRTTAGGVPVEINTVEHLIAIARTTGFEIQDNLSMEMLSSRDLFRNNATQSEHIITLTRN
jgi:site-specific DNA-methyltransferase (cytosine-N4-specific)